MRPKNTKKRHRIQETKILSKTVNNHINLQQINCVIFADCKLNISWITKMLLQLRATHNTQKGNILPSDTGHRVVMISVTVAHSQTSAYAAIGRIRG